MTKKALSDQNYQLIKSHILDPENSPLEPALQFQLDRLVSATKLLDKNPIKKHAVAFHRKKFPSISSATAYKDLSDASKLYSTYHDFDWDFWMNWILQDITENIKKCRSIGTAQHLKIIAQEHMALLKAIGDKPSDIDDPTRHEKNQFFIMVNLSKDKKLPIDLDNLDKLPSATLKELNRFLFSGKEIDDVEVEEIMNS